MNRAEVLSPAGSWESLRAAVFAGADAVYLGCHSFNARRNAANFEDDELASVVKFCHERGVKVYLTLNTLVFDREIGRALQYAALACRAGADALILQDIGLAGLIRKAAPQMKLHASTQMSIHNREGVREAAKLGFRRVVLARELSAGEIKTIAVDSPCELEVFVHGALCMSVSGQCYLSAMLGGRSGNRGLCAQPCRLPFAVCGGTGHDLSLKDLSLVNQIGELTAMGVCSLKIEGRMKRPEYVAAVTHVCVCAASGEKISHEQMHNLQSVFSRSGFTDGYYKKELGRTMFGVRQYEDVLASQAATKQFRALYEQEMPRIRVDFAFCLKNGKKAALSACDADGNRAVAEGDIPEAARRKATDAQLVKEKLSKTGGTPFYAGSIQTEIDPGLSLPVSSINALRRNALEEILQKRGRLHKIVFQEPDGFSTKDEKVVENSCPLRLRFRERKQFTEKTEGSGAALVFLPVGELRVFLQEEDGRLNRLRSKGIRLGAELPRLLFEEQLPPLRRALATLRQAGVRDALCGNLGAISVAKEAGMTVQGDFGLNIANAHSLREIIGLGAESGIVSFEQKLEQVRKTAAGNPGRAGLIAYGYLPLMLMRNCPLKNGAGCGNCPGNLKDRNGEHFPVLCRDAYSELLNTRPLWMAERKKEIRASGVGFTELYFTIESPTEVDRVLGSWAKEEKCPGNFTRGLYYRGAE